MRQIYKLHEGELEIVFDNERAVYKLSEQSLQVLLNLKHADVLREIMMARNKLHINLALSHVYGNQDKNLFLEELSLMARTYLECDIRAKSDLRANVRNNSPIPPGLTHDPKVFRIDGIKITHSVGEIIRNKNSHKEIRSFLYDRLLLQSNPFDLVDWKRFEHMTTRVPHISQLWVVKYESGFCGENGMIYKWKEFPDNGCPC